MFGLSEEGIHGLRSLTMRHTKENDQRLKQANHCYIQVLRGTGAELTFESDWEYQSDSDSDDD